MEYKYSRCPVCGVPFDDGDDIVVCPECGTPHHRACYLRNGKCANADHHGDNFSWNKEDYNTTNTKCPFCGADNPPDAIFCRSCSKPMTQADNEYNNSQHDAQQQHEPNTSQGFPFECGTFRPEAAFYNAGIDDNDEIDEGVTAKDCKNFISSNPLYYLTVFRNIKKFKKGRFNFASALFTGGWFLYRKLYLPGAIITAAMAVCFFLEAFFINDFARLYDEIIAALQSSSTPAYGLGLFSSIINYTAQNFTTQELVLFWIPPLASFARIVIMIISGFIGNKLYLKHCVKNIQKIKAENPPNLTEALNAKGGTNNVAAAVVAVCYVAYNLIIILF